jgi:putative FmdB family regulatory protein
MPIYEYSCPACQQKFEAIRPLTRSGEKGVCPRCGAPSERALSLFSSFSKNSSGVSMPVGGGGCSSCSSGSCSTCGH